MAQRILIRTPNHLGDCIMALPMISEAREAHPGAEVTLLVPENFAELYRVVPGVDEIIKIPKAIIHGLIAVMKIKDLIAPHNFDIGYILPPSFGAAAGFKLGGVKERVGYIADGRRLLLTKPLPLPAPINATHRSELYFNLLRRGAGVELEYVRPKLFLNDEDAVQGIELMKSFDIEKNDDFVVIAFQAVAESRRWGKENYIELIKRIISQLRLKVILMGSEADRNAGEEIAKATGTKEVKNLAGKTTIREIAAILSLAKYFIGNDSGPAHLAASVGIPIIVLSGADDPKSTSPAGVEKKLLYLDQLECISCVKNKCPLKSDKYMQCMTGISVDMVLEAAMAVGK